MRAKTQSENRVGYSVDEATTLLGLGRNSIYNALNAGLIESVLIGRRRVLIIHDAAETLRKLAAAKAAA